jgi:hypothetical protein
MKFMAAAQKKEYSMDEFETRYQEITRLYDLAEKLVSTVESELVSDADKQLAIVEPLILEIGDASDVLTQEFIFIAEGQKSKNKGKASKPHIQASLRKIFAALNEYHARVRDIGKKAHGTIMNIADPIVAKIQRQIEHIVVIFLEFMQVSLQNIMGKVELEALKARDTRVAMMMHQYALAQQHQG